MKPSQVRDQFSQAERSLSHAALVCEENSAVAPSMRRRLAQWQRECVSMRAALDAGLDAQQVLTRVDALEQALHRLVERCRRTAVDGEVEVALEHAHAVMADLKLKLH